ncbi:CRISPR-associated helicase Cas3' [Sporohalobacter salinus]|uniref:CRISPR-associated helicase Cas3' n=1 Tax=Sporohalobacter salinus TaxID=1494606 RepID=UPI0019617E00|nr:CRISPR-associated helicase Cas3' [Sporohalobacter salinus]MBM7623755.1 CRISPR-associated endonuclease/helicase Cas3 [Sporohalobacter salinus]
MIYAKSNPIESLKEHTNSLVNNYKELKKSYGEKLDEDNLLDLLEIAVKYHDAGKVYSQFQNMIIKNINKYQDENIKRIESEFEENVPHSYLSPAFLPYQNWNYNKKTLKVLFQTIAYHHERDTEPDSKIIAKIVEKELNKKINEVREELEVEINDRLVSLYTKLIQPKYRVRQDDEVYNLYVLLKGLLHKLDHSASAHEKVELDVDKNVGEYTEEYMKRFPNLREVQKFSRDNKDKNVIVVASTGMGKTESALLWIDEDKAFFTLPLRVSINALYDRVRKDESKEGIGYDYVGLLHSTSVDYLEESGYDDGEEVYDQSKLLSKKLIFSTIDQIFKFPFKYRGYEKSYATLAYSKVVIDEIQAYDPEIAAILLKGLEMIDKIGGKFMIMTATLPKIYINYLEEKGIITGEKAACGEFLSDTVRHKIEVKEEAIIEDEAEMIKKGKDKKVLVIVNTVARAIDVFYKLDQNNEVNINLLHSMFIKKDRGLLEKRIKEFADSERESGIWVTTQLVEASLDIDFDYLFTELSTLDSLFQRVGRCYRKREFDLDEPNVYIYTEEVKGVGTIYDQDVWKKSKKEIMNYNLQELNEKDKVKMVEKLYSRNNLEETDFLEKFDNALKYLDDIKPYERTKGEAQRILRDINNVNVIPRRIYDDIRDKIDKYKNYQIRDKKDRKKFKELRREINKYTVSIPYYKATDGRVSAISEKGERLSDIYVLNRKYDFDERNLVGRGVLIDEELGCIIG